MKKPHMLPKALIVMYSNAVDEVYYPERRRQMANRMVMLAPPLGADELPARSDLLAQAEVIFGSWGLPRLDDSLLNIAQRLRAIFYAAGTIRHWITDAVWGRNIIVCSPYAANAPTLAGYTLATLIFSLKQGWRYTLGTKRLGHYPNRIACAGAFHSKVGLISLGMVARLVCERLKNFDLQVLAYDPYAAPEEAMALGVKLVSLEEIFSECDVVSLHTPSLNETKGMITGRHFEAMRSGATLINTARGEVVNEQDLIETFIRRQDLTAVLDVTDPEPPVKDSPLYSLPNVVLTPHIAGSLDGECGRLGQLMVEEFNRWQNGIPLLWQITREKAATMA